MSHPAVTYEDTLWIVGVLQSFEPPPMATNMRTMVINLVNKLTSITNQQTATYGCTGMVDQDKLYELMMYVPWAPTIDPGPHCTVNPAVTEDKNKQAKVFYNASK